MADLIYHPNTSMTDAWDALARKDARDAILFRTTPEEFERTGQHEADYLRQVIGRFGGDQATVLDLGGGIGRVALYLAPHVAHYILADASREMLAQATERLKDMGKISLYHTSGFDLAGLPDQHLDFVFSYLTFQHMDREVQVRYLQEVFRVLKPTGGFWFQVPAMHYPERFNDVANGDWPINIRRWVPGELLELCARIGYGIDAADCDYMQVLLRKPAATAEWLRY